MSKAVRSHNIVGMTRHMEVDYKRPVPSCTPIRMEGRVLRSEGRKHWAESAILDADGKVLAQGKGLFIEVRPRHEHVALTGEPTPHG
jgi:acyl-coenzyme A thioesterase PaaI-like protein